MSKFPIVPYMIHKTDGSNETVQAMPQTDIKAVRGLNAKISKYDQFLLQLTHKNVDYIITKQDLAKYATKDDLSKSAASIQKYVDSAVKNALSNFGPTQLADGTNVDTLTKTGIYYKTKGIKVTGLPPYDTINQSGILIVMNGSDNRIWQKWISMDLVIYEYQRIPLYPLNNPIKWGQWTYKN